MCGETAPFLNFVFWPLDKVSKNVMSGAMAAIFRPSFGQMEKRKEMYL